MKRDIKNKNTLWAVFKKHLRENLKLRENFGIEWQQNQKTLQV